MAISARITALVFAMVFIGPLTVAGHAEQWYGPGNPNGTIWRPGNVALGMEPAAGNDSAALLNIRRPLSGTDEVLFSAGAPYKDSQGQRFEIDTRRAYAGGARSKSGILSGDLDFAVHRKAAIGVVNMNERIPSDYMLVVGGKILAEEVRIKAIKDWADYVFAPNYRLQALPQVEAFIRTHHHLPGIPTAVEVEQNGVALGELQAKLLLKIEELTLYLIEQNKTIDALKSELARIQSARPSAARHLTGHP